MIVADTAEPDKPCKTNLDVSVAVPDLTEKLIKSMSAWGQAEVAAANSASAGAVLDLRSMLATNSSQLQI
jgi:hypothetical protein